jgi:hypothetical protein
MSNQLGSIDRNLDTFDKKTLQIPEGQCHYAFEPASDRTLTLQADLIQTGNVNSD